MKTFFRNIHLYLSLAAGLVIMTCCFTGAVLVFEKELQQVFNPSRYFVKTTGQRLSIDELTAQVKQTYNSAKINAVKVYGDTLRTVEIGIALNDPSKNKGKKSAKQRTAGPQRATHTVFINPYTAEITSLYNYRETFFYTMFALHRWLLGGENSIGKSITGISTFIFLFILITGIILWWPKTNRILKQRLKIRSDAGWKRVNHDLHLVLGFYSSIFLFIFAFTALAWSFEWFNKGIYTVTKSDMKMPEPPASLNKQGVATIQISRALHPVQQLVPSAESYKVRLPSDTSATFTIAVHNPGFHDGVVDNYYVDQYTGMLAGSMTFNERNLGQRVRSTIKPIHTGAIFGTPSKIIALIVCIFGITFPITGTIMWLNRIKTKKPKKSVSAVAVNG